MPRYIDTDIKNHPFLVLVKTKHMLNEVDIVPETPSKHLLDFNDDEDCPPDWEDPDQVDKMLQEELNPLP